MSDTINRTPRQVLELGAAQADARWQDEEGAEYWHSAYGWQHESSDPNHEPYKPRIYTEILADTTTLFPAVITAPALSFPIAQTIADAVSLYDEFTFAIGVDQMGRRLEYSPGLHPHILIIGGSGTGKSVFLHGLIEPYRAAGFAVFLCDGRGTDYTAYPSLVTAVSSEIPEHVRLMHTLVEELGRRRRIALQRRFAGDPNPVAFEPWLLVFDEYSEVRDDILSDYDSNGGDKPFIRDLKCLLKFGGEFRIHLVLVGQSAYSSSFPRSLVENFGLVIALGKPEKMTLENVFPKDLRDRARQIGHAMQKEHRGRGIVADPAAGTVTEFQAYSSYYPGADIDAQAPEIRDAWIQYRDTVTEKIPRLYGRQWFKVESASDLEKPIEKLHEIPMVNLDLANGEPDPDAVQYDKQHLAYNGYTDSTKGGKGILPLSRET